MTTTASVLLLLVGTLCDELQAPFLHLTLNPNLDLAFEAKLQRLDVKESAEASSWHAFVLPPQLREDVWRALLLTCLACC